jgi:hypothetical protein
MDFYNHIDLFFYDLAFVRDLQMLEEKCEQLQYFAM